MKISKFMRVLVCTFGIFANAAFAASATVVNSNNTVLSAKIGFVDQQVLLQQSLYVKDYMQKLEKEFQPKREELTASAKNFKLKQEQFVRDRDILSAKDAQAKEEDLNKEIVSIQKFKENLEIDIQNRDSRYSKEMREHIMAVVEAIAAAEKLDLVIDKGAVLYSTGRSDYTYKVLQSLDANFNKQNNSTALKTKK